MAGREVLIKAVAQASPTYVMSCFKLPDNLYKEIDFVTARFWWGRNEIDSRIHWKNLKAMCTSKHSRGIGI